MVVTKAEYRRLRDIDVADLTDEATVALEMRATLTDTSVTIRAKSTPGKPDQTNSVSGSRQTVQMLE